MTWMKLKNLGIDYADEGRADVQIGTAEKFSPSGR